MAFLASGAKSCARDGEGGELVLGKPSPRVERPISLPPQGDLAVVNKDRGGAREHEERVQVVDGEVVDRTGSQARAVEEGGHRVDGAVRCAQPVADVQVGNQRPPAVHHIELVAGGAGQLPPSATVMSTSRWVSCLKVSVTCRVCSRPVAGSMAVRRSPKRSDDMRGFVVLPKRWIVERFFAHLMQSRRLVRAFERCTASAEAMVYWSMTLLMTRRLARPHPSRV